MTAALDTEVVAFRAGDGMELNLHHVRGPREPWRGPVVLVPGAGVRANLFRVPERVTVVDRLIEAGWDVWLENWRASIDLPRNEWNLDQAAVWDHPYAVRKILERTGSGSVKAVIHCQGSSSFALSAAAGLLPQVDTIVSNSMSLHPVVARWSRLKLFWLVPRVAPLLRYLDPRWGDTVSPPGWAARALVAMVNATHRECDNGPCRMISFTYGAGRPALWSHENLSERTHDWLRHEFGSVPLTFFTQMAASVASGQLVPTGAFDELPPDLLDHPPRTDARIALITGTENRCFLPASQQRTFDYLEAHRPGRQTLRVIPGYGHLDMFMGRYADRDVFGHIADELAGPTG